MNCKTEIFFRIVFDCYSYTDLIRNYYIDIGIHIGIVKMCHVDARLERRLSNKKKIKIAKYCIRIFIKIPTAYLYLIKFILKKNVGNSNTYLPFMIYALILNYDTFHKFSKYRYLPMKHSHQSTSKFVAKIARQM